MKNKKPSRTNKSKQNLVQKKFSLVFAIVFIAILVASGVAIVYFSKAADSPYVPSGYVLKWSDEFDGTSIDTTKWNVANNSTYGSNNNELQCYMASNITVAGGNAVITGKPGTGGCAGYNYTSGWMETGIKAAGSTEKYTFTQGYVEMRAKMPSGNIFWPALWLQGASGGPSWPAYGEFDIGEWYPACPNMTTGTLHYDTDGNPTNGGTGHQQTSPDVYNVSNYTANNKGGCSSGLGAINNDFHIYGFEWTTNKLTWFVDGRVMFYFDGTNNTMNWVENGVNQTKAFPQPTTDFWNVAHTISINLAMGGNGPSYYGWSPTNTIGSTTGDYLVDYIRVYQKDTGGTTTGSTTGSTTGTTGTTSSTGTTGTTVTVGDLKGQVTNARTGKPVNQVYVTVNYGSTNHQVRTDNQGFYTIKGIPEGSYSVKFAKSKYSTQYITQSIVAGQTQTLNVSLKPL